MFFGEKPFDKGAGFSGAMGRRKEKTPEIHSNLLETAISFPFQEEYYVVQCKTEGINMTKGILMYQRQYHDRDGHRYGLEYYLLIDQIFFGGSCLDLYGAEIRHFQNGRLIAQRTIRGITPFGTQISSILNRLSDGLILPGNMDRMVDRCGISCGRGA